MSSNIKKELRDWLRSHRAHIIDSSKRAHRFTKENVRYFQFGDDYNKLISENASFDTETLYTIEISESELERIAEFEMQVFNNLKREGHFNLFERLLEQKEKEKLLKEKYPAVQKAYENYSLMLKLAETGEL